jgi:hypothetical protein
VILQNPRHEQFAQAIAKGANQSTAAKLAGYSERTACEQGSRLVRNAQIRARIEELRNRGAEQCVVSISIDKSWVINKLVSIADKCTSKEHYAPGAANKSLELIGKELGMFQDMIPRVIFDSLLYRMGEAVVSVIDDPVLLDKIAAKWQMIKEQHPMTRGGSQVEEMQNAIAEHSGHLIVNVRENHA